jgi:hypothetical protein
MLRNVLYHRFSNRPVFLNKRIECAFTLYLMNRWV